MKILFWVAFLGACANNFNGLAQTGLLCSDKKYENIPALPPYTGEKFNDIPIKINLKKYCPVAGDQQALGTCVGWAVGYHALTIAHSIHGNITDKALITQRANSAAFVFNQVKINANDCNKGAFIEDALELIKNTGDCLEESFNFKNQECNQIPNNELFEEASFYRFQHYASLFSLEMEEKVKISAACKVLATHTPIIIGIGITPSFNAVLPGQRLWDPLPTEQISGYHAMVVTGYDNVEKRFLLLNSFGPAWGNEGFIEIPFDDFARLCRYAYMIMLTSENPSRFAQRPDQQSDAQSSLTEKEFSFSGEFIFRKPGGYAESQEGEQIMLFEEAETILVDSVGTYVTRQPSFPVGEIFQLIARKIPRGRHAYVFSQNPEGKIQLHFPKLKKQGETASFFIEKTAEIVLPGEESALQLSAPGIDYLCILYSFDEIEDIGQRISKLEAAQGEIIVKILAVFGDKIISNNKIRYDPTRMAFMASASPGKGRVAVPVILKVLAE